MRKVAVVFVLAVFVPSLVLAWLAVRSLRDQEYVIERQQSLLYQNTTDALAHDVENTLLSHQHEFASQVESILAGGKPAVIAPLFDDELRTNWPLAEVGFVVTMNGVLSCPSPYSRSPAARRFLANNASFIASRKSAEVYWNAKQILAQAQNATAKNTAQPPPAGAPAQKPIPRNVYPQAPLQQTIVSQDGGYPLPQPAQQNLSRIAPAEAEFQQLIGDANEGTVARFVANRLNVLFWYRSPRDPQYVFGAQLDLRKLIRELSALLGNIGPSLREDICVALLDDNARPVALSQPGFRADWRRPFVATEIGEELPHWEIAAYLLDPAKLTRSAQTIRLTLGLLIAMLVLAIGIGSWLIVSDLNRQLAFARQKTDFVSNVSHELKTPLTSIRMFSELLAEQRVSDPAKQRSYLGIITAETARLTRLINNVLDFARIERGEKKYAFQDCDLANITRETAESYRPHLENEGFKLECALPENSVRVRGDADALAQVIVNLLSNAEKYAGDKKEIGIRLDVPGGVPAFAEVRVLDRGAGVPRGSEEQIFEKFYRAHDALGSGIHGSGLGLTLARQIARAHGGDVTYERRDSGGSCFCLRLPLINQADEHI